MSLLELRDIHRRVKLPDGETLTILDGVNLSIEAGEHVSIVGRSGSGKSTLLNLIGLLDSPSSGSYRFDDRELTKLSSGRRDRMRGRNFGFVFQQFNLLPGRTAKENVETPLYYGGAREFFRRGSLSAEVLEQVGLGDRLGNLPTQLSGGEQQRVSIARALVRRPRLILADEPTGALDVDTGVQVMELLSEVAQSTGAGLIVITHDPAVARRADTVYRLDAGVLTSEVLV